jgi:hypothetical protein
MKPTILLLFTLFTLNAAGQTISFGFFKEPDYKNDWNRRDLKGKVKTYESIMQVASTCKVAAGNGRSTVKFNSKGQQTEVHVYAGKRDSYDEIYIYNSLGKISLINRCYPEGESWCKRDSFLYENDIVTTISTPTKNSTNKKLHYSYDKYDKKGNKIESSYQPSKGDIKISRKWTYDEQGNNIEEIRYLFSKKEDDERYVRNYDNKGNMIVVFL